MKKLVPALFVLILALLLPVQALADETVSLKVGFINLNADGNFATNRLGLPAVNLANLITLDDDGNEVMAEAALQLGSLRLSAGYLPLNFTGRNPLAGDVGELDVRIYDLGLAWHIINMDDAPVRLQLGPELAVKIVDGDVSTTLAGQPIDTVSGTVPVPTIGARARVGLGDFVGLIGRVGYLEVSGNSFLDADAQVEFSPLPFVGVFAGYRYLDLEVDENDIFIDATFDGPYAGAFVRF